MNLGTDTRKTAILAAALAVLAARAAAAAPLALGAGSTLWLEGTSTLHPYKSTAAVINASADLDGGAPLGEGIRSGRFAGFAVEIPVAGLKSGEKGLDRNMYAALKASAHPSIRFTLSRYALRPHPTAAAAFLIAASGTLEIAGAQRPLDLEATAQDGPDGFRIWGERKLLMTDFGVAPPKLFLGALKVRDEVTVHFDLTLQTRNYDAKTAKEKIP